MATPRFLKSKPETFRANRVKRPSSEHSIYNTSRTEIQQSSRTLLRSSPRPLSLHPQTIISRQKKKQYVSRSVTPNLEMNSSTKYIRFLEDQLRVVSSKLDETEMRFAVERQRLERTNIELEIELSKLK